MWSEDDGGKLVLAATPWGDDKDKAEVLGRLKEHMRKNNVTTFCMVSEAWLSSFNIEDPRAKQLMTGEIKPSQDDLLS